jgi:hypothetical protein
MAIENKNDRDLKNDKNDHAKIKKSAELSFVAMPIMMNIIFKFRSVPFCILLWFVPGFKNENFN